MRAEGCPDNSQLSLLLCGDRRIRSLNRRWRGQDRATDVLSFSQLEARRGDQPGRAGYGEPLLLGDVVISVPTAAKQAARAGRTLAQELRFLLAHGILHLLGWNDATAALRERMLARQQEILVKK